MRLVYDFQVFSMQRFGGVSRYFTELISGIRDWHPDVDVELVGRWADNTSLGRLGVPYTRLFHLYGGRGRGRLITIADYLNWKMVRRRTAAGDMCVYHPTYYQMHQPTGGGGCPVVLTVHDMIHELFELPDREKTMESKRRAVEAADHIITGSEHTKRDVQELLGVDGANITVIPHGRTFRGDEPGNRQLALPERFILYVGARAGYKNFSGFFDAIAEILRGDPSLHLVCAGGCDFTASERASFERAALSARILHTPADDASLATQYRRALLLAFPSKYEGFGLPVLEAMSFGCPVVCSDASSVPEVGGDAVRYFDPDSVTDMVQGVNAVLSDDVYRSALQTAGRQRANQFSWRASVEAHLEVYRSVLL
ncbi:MAG: glycosyltransferase family 4 protein [Coriobacteriia bacterium]|nr:glycosyltransferase family 4 protein [Coriobacteriia bacterium]